MDMHRYTVQIGASVLFAALWFVPINPARSADSAQTLSGVYETGEEYPGGDATSDKSENNSLAFSHPVPNLTEEQLIRFRAGNELFQRDWEPATGQHSGGEGLGPMFNAKSCASCHIRDGRGHPPKNANDDFISMLFFLASSSSRARRTENAVPHPVYGTQIQDFSVPGITPEAKPRVEYEEFEVKLNGGEVAMLRKPIYRFVDLANGPLGEGTQISPRVANPMIGMGLLEAIPDERLRELADPDDADGDGISGRPNRVWDKRLNAIVNGRFGWKAGQPNVVQQTALALSGDMGLSTSFFPNGHGDCTDAQTDCLAAPTGEGEVEVSDQALDQLTFYARNLAVPPRLHAKDLHILKGKALFNTAGCASCHTPKHVTSSDDATPKQFRGQTIWPYTDMLLHDMGEGLADGFSEGVATGREWRTPPLWGIGRTRKVNKHTFFLHDGRARNVLEAILWHGGEAEAAKQAVVDMTPDERRHLLAFLNDASSLPIAFERKEKLADEIIKHHVVPRFDKLTAATVALEERLKNICSTGAPLGNARGAFKTALSAWMGVQHIRSGPSKAHDRYERFQTWPDENSSKGFSELEVVLFAKPDPEARDNLCELAVSKARKLRELAEETTGAWASYKPESKAAGVDLFMRNMMEQLQTMRDLKLKRPLGENFDDARPKLAESWRSGSSYANLSDNFDALAELFEIMRIALETNDENRNVAKATADLLAFGAAETRDQSTSLAQAVEDAEKRKFADFLVTHIDGIRAWLGESLAPALDVQIGFNVKDGN